MISRLLCAAALASLAAGLAACGTYEGSSEPSTASMYSGTPLPTSAAPSIETPGTGEMDQGKRAGSHAL